MPRPVPRKPYTHFTENEITGSTHYDKKTDWPMRIVVTAFSFAVSIALYDLFIGIDTEWLASLIFGTV